MVFLIIAVLAALLSPVLRTVREQGRMAQCASNMRQVGLDIHAYLGENSGRLPGFKNPHISDTWWYYLYADSGFRDFNRRMTCPSKEKGILHYKAVDSAGKPHKLEGCYLYNSMFGWTPAPGSAQSGRPIINLRTVANASRLVMLAEWSMEPEPTSRLGFSTWDPILGRHRSGKASLVLCLDGHIETITEVPPPNLTMIPSF